MALRIWKMKQRNQKYHPDHEPCKDMWSSDSSGDEDLEAAMSNHGM